MRYIDKNIARMHIGVKEAVVEYLREKISTPRSASVFILTPASVSAAMSPMGMPEIFSETMILGEL